MPVARKPEGRHHHGALRRALLDAVAEILRESGPHGMTLRAAARRAGVSHSAATPHFQDLAGLLTAFVAEGNERLAATMRRHVEADPGHPLLACGRGYIAFAAANPAHFRMMFGTAPKDDGDPALQAARQAAFAPLREAMAALHPSVPEAALRDRLGLAWAAVHGFAALRAEGAGAKLWPEPDALAAAEGMLRLVVAACAAPPSGPGA
ncbi:TetR/AcrR family transcriptional regulator [Roseomonas sp. HF4]|uniref:TetR/AcrR family transcriptional regulator n=1 Tax=Roseomonas sp. HF4 TaxID=2562313 RepID=UPI001484D7BE|nr:TetR/AcrR family transcriptional regulator [Roseomonas sp. HF4]